MVSLCLHFKNAFATSITFLIVSFFIAIIKRPTIYYFLAMVLLINMPNTTYAQNAPLGCDKYTLLISDNKVNNSFAEQQVIAIPFPSPIGQMPANACELGPNVGGESVIIDPVKNIAYIASTNTVIKVYNFATGTFLPNIVLTSGTGADMALLGITLSPDRQFLYANTYSGMYKISVDTGSIVDSLLGTGFWGVSWNTNTNKVYYSTNWRTDIANLSLIQFTDPALGTPTTAFTAPANFHFRDVNFASDGTLWATAASSAGVRDVLYHFSVKTDGTLGVLGTYNIPPRAGGPIGVNPFGTAIGPDGNIYIASWAGACVIQFDPITNTFTDYIPYVAGTTSKTLGFVCGNFKCPCSNDITANVGAVSAGTCTGNIPTNNGTATITGIGVGGVLSNTMKAEINIGTTYGTTPIFGAATNKVVSGGAITFNNLKPNTDYAVRIWNGSDGCYKDITFKTPILNCPCTSLTTASISKNPTGNINAGTTLNLTASATGINGTSTYNWAGGLAGSPTVTGAFSSTTVAKPTWSAPTAGTYNFTVTIRNTDGTGTCSITATNSVNILSYDLSLHKTVSTSTVSVGGTATFVISVANQGTGVVTGVKVTDTFTPNTGFSINNAIASVGTFSQTTGIWDIGTVAVGSTVNLSITITVGTCGILFNTAEITAMNEIDLDSTPNNGTAGEDDIDRACVSTPCPICPGESYTVTAPSTYTNVKWFKDGGVTAIATGNSYSVTATGSYTYTTDNATCPTAGCCAFVVSEGNCCAISASLTQSPCNNNGTPTIANKTDDYFNINISASNGTSTGSFEVVLNGAVIGVGTYNTNIVLSGVGGRFKADGTSIYTLTIRDQKNYSCSTTKTTTAITDCSTACPPQVCPTITSQKKP